MKRDPRLVVLSREHHDGLVLAQRIAREVAGSDPAATVALYGDLLDFWERGLLRHFRAECECLLARLVRQVGIEDELVRRTQSDHLRLDALVADMRDTEDEAVRRAAMARFGALLQQHIRWEEERLFEATQQFLGADDMEALGRDLQARLPEQAFPNIWGSTYAG